MHLLCLLYITRTGNFTDLWTKVVTYGDSRLLVSEKQHCWGSNPWPSGFTDTYGRWIMRFRTPSLCLGTLKGICSKTKRLHCHHNAKWSFMPTPPLPVSPCTILLFSPLLALSTLPFSSLVHSWILCRLLNQICLPLSPTFTHQSFPLFPNS